MTLRQIKEIFYCLAELSHLELPYGYAIAKNMRAARKIVAEHEAIVTELMQQAAIKDDDGGALRCLYTRTGDEPVLKNWNHGDAIPDGYYVSYRVEEAKRDEIMRQINAALDEEVDITWHRIPWAQVKESKVPGLYIEPLIGVVIEEE